VKHPRPLAVLAALAAAANLAAAAGIRFTAPTFEDARYAIRLAYEVKAGPVTVSEIRLNGAPFAQALIFKDGRPVDRTKPLGPGTYDIVLGHAWATGKKYTVSLVHGSAGKARPKSSDVTGVSPAAGGVPAGCDEGLCWGYRVSEEAGLARSAEVCYLTLTASRADLGEAGLRLFDGEAEVPFQVLDRRESEAPQAAAAANPPAVTVKLAFPLDAAPNQKKVLLLFKGKAGKVPGGDLVLSGERLGRTLSSPGLVLTFHPQSGQILTIEYPKEKVRLWNKAGVIHWNPDVFIPGLAWDHSFDWNPPEAFGERTGGLVYLNARRGPLAHIRDVDLEVRYEVPAGQPFFIAETRLTFGKDLGVIAVRNDEMVFYGELFDGLMYKDKDGRVVTLPLKERPEAPFGLAHIAPDDLPWVGLVNTREGYGFFSLRLRAAASSLGPAGDFAHKAGTYFYAPADGDYVYWVRPYFYTWGDYGTNNLLTFVPKGSFFYEKNAYVLLRLTDGTPAELDTLLRKLRDPLRVF
jgi:hypothetical protein